MVTATLDETRAEEEQQEQERRTTYLELFFDLVFVYAITQVTTLLLRDMSAAGFARAALLLALLWWAWSGFTWTTTTVDLESTGTKLLYLAGMGGAFFVALAVPRAYGQDGAWFAIAYVFVRLVNLGLDMWGRRLRRSELVATLHLAPFFLVAPALVLVGGLATAGRAREGFWVAALVVDLVGIFGAGGKSEWRVSPSHFAERYALIVIIALGESIGRLGANTMSLPRDSLFAVSHAVALAGVAVLWWAYFGFFSEAVERALRAASPSQLGRLARDVCSLCHYPMVFGIVLYAVAAKKVLADANDPLSRPSRAALGLGVALFLVGFVLGRYRAARTVGWERAAAAPLVLVAVVVLRDLDAVALLAVVCGILAAAVAAERVRITRGFAIMGEPGASKEPHTE